MQNKNNTILFSAVFIIIGILLGSFVFNNKGERKEGMHMMNDGQMMHDSSMGMDNMMDSMMSGLQDKNGNEFDKAFLSEMIMHHEGAVEMAKAVLKTSKRPELIKLANDIISAQTKEIEMMKDWQKNWFN